jgi:hypothetical protein
LKKLRTSCSQAGLRLRDVGSRHLADIEPVTCLFHSIFAGERLMTLKPGATLHGASRRVDRLSDLIDRQIGHARR